MNQGMEKETAKYWVADITGGLDCLYGQYFTFSFAPHFHNSYAVGVIEHGDNVFDYRGAKRIASAGEIMLFNPAEVHTGEAADKRKGWSFRMFFVDAELLKQVREEITEKVSDVPFFSAAVIRDDSMARRILHLHRALENSTSELEAECLFLIAMAQLLIKYGDSRINSRKIGNESLAVARAREYLLANARENVTLDELAHVANLSPYHLLRVFRDETGLPPHAYQIQIRIEQAKQLLRDDFTISETAQVTGFFDQAHFSKQFKRYVGITPGRFLIGN
jgi:AraC-like DNA-binding protein